MGRSLRKILTILIACTVFVASLAGFFILNETFALLSLEEFLSSTMMAFLLALLVPSFLTIAGGVVAAPKAGLRSDLLDRIRGDVPPIAGKWASTIFIGLSVSLLATLSSAAIQVSSPVSFSTAEYWRSRTWTSALEQALWIFAVAMLCWVGLLSILAWGCLKIFGPGRRTFALAVAIALMEGLCFGSAALLSIYLDYPFNLTVVADSATWSIATIVCAWLYVTRTLEHGILALMWVPVVIMALRPLWDHLGI